MNWTLKARRIEETLAAFRVEAKVREINPGAAVTQFALEPGAGVKVRSIKILENDLALALAASTIAIETPIPGQSRVGIVIPNKNIAIVGLRETMESPEFLSEQGQVAAGPWSRCQWSLHHRRPRQDAALANRWFDWLR